MEHDPLLITRRDKFIEENKDFIYNITCGICKRKLQWQNDDELSIALIAFNNACDSYNQEKGTFLPYAKVIIKNALIDYFRKSKYTPCLAFSNEDETFDYIDSKNSLMEFEKQQENLRRAEEISHFSIELAKYKLSIDDLIEASPSHLDTRNTILNVAFKCSREENIIKYIREKKNLPIKEMMLLTSMNRKFFEKWRKYILVLILILSSNDYPYIRSYFNIKVGENHE